MDLEALKQFDIDEGTSALSPDAARAQLNTPSVDIQGSLTVSGLRQWGTVNLRYHRLVCGAQGLQVDGSTAIEIPPVLAGVVSIADVKNDCDLAFEAFQRRCGRR